MLKKVSTNKAPGAIGPYSQAIIYENLLYLYLDLEEFDQK